MSKCSIKLNGRCWKCTEAYKEMIHHLATGATIHELHNTLQIMRGACMLGNAPEYQRAKGRFHVALRQGVSHEERLH